MTGIVNVLIGLSSRIVVFVSLHGIMKLAIQKFSLFRLCQKKLK